MAANFVSSDSDYHLVIRLHSIFDFIAYLVVIGLHSDYHLRPTRNLPSHFSVLISVYSNPLQNRGLIFLRDDPAPHIPVMLPEIA